MGATAIAIGAFAISADHVDSPSVAGSTADIADFYAFEGNDDDNTVFIATIQGLLAPGSATENASFDEAVMIEINIDNSGDLVEDLVIQAIPRGDSMYFFGPAAPNETGLTSTVNEADAFVAVPISGVDDQRTATRNDGVMYYAGPRRDAFFFDFDQFNAVAGGMAPGGFSSEANAEDAFDGTNVLAVVVEVPNSLLGDAPTHVGASVGLTGLPDSYNTWVSTKRRQ